MVFQKLRSLIHIFLTFLIILESNIEVFAQGDSIIIYYRQHFRSIYRARYHAQTKGNKGVVAAQVTEATVNWLDRLSKVLIPILVVGASAAASAGTMGAVFSLLAIVYGYRLGNWIMAKKNFLGMSRILEYAQAMVYHYDLDDSELRQNIVGGDVIKKKFDRAKVKFDLFFEKLVEGNPTRFSRDYVKSALVTLEQAGEFLTAPDDQTVMHMFQSGIVDLKLAGKINNNIHLVYKLAKAKYGKDTFPPFPENKEFLTLCLKADKAITKHFKKLDDLEDEPTSTAEIIVDFFADLGMIKKQKLIMQSKADDILEKWIKVRGFYKPKATGLDKKNFIIAQVTMLIPELDPDHRKLIMETIDPQPATPEVTKVLMAGVKKRITDIRERHEAMMDPFLLDCFQKSVKEQVIVEERNNRRAAIIKMAKIVADNSVDEEEDDEDEEDDVEVKERPITRSTRQESVSKPPPEVVPPPAVVKPQVVVKPSVPVVMTDVATDAPSGKPVTRTTRGPSVSVRKPSVVVNPSVPAVRSDISTDAPSQPKSSNRPVVPPKQTVVVPGKSPAVLMNGKARERIE